MNKSFWTVKKVKTQSIALQFSTIICLETSDGTHWISQGHTMLKLIRITDTKETIYVYASQKQQGRKFTIYEWCSYTKGIESSDCSVLTSRQERAKIWWMRSRSAPFLLVRNKFQNASIQFGEESFQQRLEPTNLIFSISNMFGTFHTKFKFSFLLVCKIYKFIHM